MTIENKKQLEITKESIKKFERSLTFLKIEQEAIQSQLDDMRADVVLFEAKKEGWAKDYE